MGGESGPGGTEAAGVGRTFSIPDGEFLVSIECVPEPSYLGASNDTPFPSRMGPMHLLPRFLEC